METVTDTYTHRQREGDRRTDTERETDRGRQPWSLLALKMSGYLRSSFNVKSFPRGSVDRVANPRGVNSVDRSNDGLSERGRGASFDPGRLCVLPQGVENIHATIDVCIRPLKESLVE